jgi:hypothetical protein
MTDPRGNRRFGEAEIVRDVREAMTQDNFVWESTVDLLTASRIVSRT